MSCKNDKYTVDKDHYEMCLKHSRIVKSIDFYMNIQMRNHKLLTKIPAELEHAVKCRCNQICTVDDISTTLQDNNSCHNCGPTDHYPISLPEEKKKDFAVNKVPEEEIQEEDSESDSIGDAIRETSDGDQDPIEEFLVYYQE
ncbi:hypothetical protein O181_018528 [Austropuccinia psidii MF-1]|uniref:Uncharacterized protein n=1 Tax=Austropuccinia psidii MF-1 TaxID=1389203 RepID=A0A9Q3C992_9BASI|nr:hypothetical protein [Austropuccinia psidii MF-1]